MPRANQAMLVRCERKYHQNVLLSKLAYEYLQGDSGGPLMCLREDSSAITLCGIVSGGDRYCNIRNDYPAFYTRISEYQEWIKARIDGMCKTVL